MTTKAELQAENTLLRNLNRTVTGIHIGASEGTIKAANASVMEILNCGADQKTKRVALKQFGVVCSVNNTAITGCSISMADIGLKDDS